MVAECHTSRFGVGDDSFQWLDCVIEKDVLKLSERGDDILFVVEHTVLKLVRVLPRLNIEEAGDCLWLLGKSTLVQLGEHMRNAGVVVVICDVGRHESVVAGGDDFDGSARTLSWEITAANSGEAEIAPWRGSKAHGAWVLYVGERDCFWLLGGEYLFVETKWGDDCCDSNQSQGQGTKPG